MQCKFFFKKEYIELLTLVILYDFCLEKTVTCFLICLDIYLDIESYFHPEVFDF